MTDIIPIPALSDNYIWLLRKGQHATVVDPGEAQPVVDYLDTNGLELNNILITHHHADHTAGVAKLKQIYGCHVYGPNNPTLAMIDTAVSESSRVDLPELDLHFDVLEIPAHTLDHIAYANAEMVFCGDTLFAAGCGRVFEGTHEQMLNALNKLSQLPDTTKIYCGHEYTLSNLAFAQTVEPNNSDIQARIIGVQQLRDSNQPSLPSHIGIEKLTNPFLRSEVPELMQYAQQQTDQSLDTALDVFTIIRQCKDNF
tara:strand:+ start:219736 stop:220500 length:765 start_codon:yes stop_codon:yes gene_type:complete